MAETKTRLVAIHGGGDWADASVDYIQLPVGVSMQAVKAAWNEWYRETYCGGLARGANPVFYNLAEFACKFFGATEDDTLEVFSDL